MFHPENRDSQLGDGLDDLHPIHVENGVAEREDFEVLLKHIYGP